MTLCLRSRADWIVVARCEVCYWMKSIWVAQKVEKETKHQMKPYWFQCLCEGNITKSIASFKKHCDQCPEFVGNELELHWHCVKLHGSDDRMPGEPILRAKNNSKTLREVMKKQLEILHPHYDGISSCA